VCCYFLGDFPTRELLNSLAKLVEVGLGRRSEALGMFVVCVAALGERKGG
jgi:hypothetical protein